MLVPADYDDAALVHPLTRALMDKIEFVHGGPEYDARYPDGIPTTVEIDHRALGRLSSGLVMYPEGHARNTSGDLPRLLAHKFRVLAGLGVRDVNGLLLRFSGLAKKSSAELLALYDFEIAR
jgi:2-methylcitrate dehydratase